MKCDAKACGREIDLHLEGDGDYCGICGNTLCLECFAHGCCEHTPAVSGEAIERQLMSEAEDSPPEHRAAA